MEQRHLNKNEPALTVPVPRPTLFGIRKLPPPKNFDSPTSASLYLNQFTISSIAEMEARADLLKLASELEIRGFPNQKRRPYFVTDAANCILRERSSQRDAPTVGPNWTSRFLKRHGYFKKRQKRLQAERQVSENLTRVNQYFQHLRQVIQDNGIPPEDIWNMDETGFRIGVGKDQLIVTKRRRAHYFGIPENRESATAIEAISANGEMHMASWYQIPELDPDTVIRPTPTGYSNDVISLDTRKKSSRSSKRLLILDGHGSHHTRQFIEYCDNHNIIPFGMPPNLTHALQPLDVVVFQPLKHYHAKALDVMVRDGLVNITKLEFLSCIQQVRLHAFKESTIRSAFRKTGIFPFNPQVVLQCLEARQATTPTPPPNSGPHSSPFETPLTLRQINKVADKLDLVLEDDKSLDPDFSHDLSRFIRGSLSLATELVQTKRDLGRTKMAERIQKQRKAMKNIQLQSGGVLSVAQGREMIAKARKVVEDAEKRRITHASDGLRKQQKRHANGGVQEAWYAVVEAILGRGVEILGIPEVGACEFQIKWGVARVLDVVIKSPAACLLNKTDLHVWFPAIQQSINPPAKLLQRLLPMGPAAVLRDIDLVAGRLPQHGYRNSRGPGLCLSPHPAILLAAPSPLKPKGMERPVTRPLSPPTAFHWLLHSTFAHQTDRRSTIITTLLSSFLSHLRPHCTRTTRNRAADASSPATSRSAPFPPLRLASTRDQRRPFPPFNHFFRCVAHIRLVRLHCLLTLPFPLLPPLVTFCAAIGTLVLLDAELVIPRTSRPTYPPRPFYPRRPHRLRGSHVLSELAADLTVSSSALLPHPSFASDSGNEFAVSVSVFDTTTLFSPAAGVLRFNRPPLAFLATSANR
ncbi:DDE superfamily endonuclease [Hirsutella rhossiliensis]